MNEKRKVVEFKRKYKLKEINSAVLWDILIAQGYTLVEFNNIRNNENVAALIDALQLHDQIAHSKCFTFQNDKYRIIFIHEDLNDEERTIVLAHEEGHISNGHLLSNNVFGTDVIQEYEANEFAHYLLRDSTGRLRRIKIFVALCILIPSFITIMSIFFRLTYNKTVYMDDLYRSENGTKYHIEDCMYIRDKSNTYQLTQEEFDLGVYAPCEACMPDKR